MHTSMATFYILVIDVSKLGSQGSIRCCLIKGVGKVDVYPLLIGALIFVGVRFLSLYINVVLSVSSNLTFVLFRKCHNNRSRSKTPSK